MTAPNGKEIEELLRKLREQEKELAALKEQKKPTYCLGLETVRIVAKEGQMETGLVDFVAADSLFHAELFIDADLLAIAEMAIASYKEALVDGCNFPNGEKILREFREQKAKVNHD